MELGWLIELSVVLTFGLAWGCLELYTRRLDRRQAEEEKRAAADKTTSGGT